MNQKPTIVIELVELPACRRGETPAHVRVCMYEPKDNKPGDRVGFAGLLHNRADFRWWIPAGKSLPAFFSENYIFDPRVRTKFQNVTPDKFVKTDEAGCTQYAVKLERGQCTPCIDVHYLGEYVLEGKAHNVVAFITEDLTPRVITPGLRAGSCYMLNTAQSYAEEAFFDFMHLALTSLGFTTLYVKPAARHFETENEIPLSETGETLYTCPTTGQKAWVRLVAHDPNYHYREIFLLRATKPDHPFALDKGDLRNALMLKTFDFKCRFEVDENFEWV